MRRWPLGASTFIWTSPFGNDCLDLIDKAVGLGFELIEICIENPTTIDTGRISRRLEQAGIGATVCGAFGPGRDVSSTDPAIRAAGVDYIATCVRVATELGSPLVAGPMYSATGKTALLPPAERRQQWAWGVENLQRAGDIAAAAGIRLAIEPLNRFETDFLNTVAQANTFVDAIGRDNVGLLLDTFHMNIEEHSVPDAIRAAGKRVFHFHACANDRGTPGKDHLPWPQIAMALDDIAYRGPWVIESFTPTITEIARAVSLWRPLAESQDRLAGDGLAFLDRLQIDHRPQHGRSDPRTAGDSPATSS